jgi:hypothetical protein
MHAAFALASEQILAMWLGSGAALGADASAL